MSDTLKGLLIIASVLTVGWILRKIRKNKVKMEDAIFWIFFAAILLLLAIFPEISYELCRIFGIMSPSNLVFLVIIFLLVEKIFTLLLYLSWKTRLECYQQKLRFVPRLRIRRLIK